MSKKTKKRGRPKKIVVVVPDVVKPVDTVVKRKPGRPRKTETSVQEIPVQIITDVVVKRKPGRPKKAATEVVAEMVAVEKKRRGRPKKNVDEVSVPKKRGRKPKPTLQDIDPVRYQIITEIEKIYTDEGYEWLLKDNPREKYTTEQLQHHLNRLKQGHRAWKMPLKD